ncbi:MAG: hypothetical protein IGR93_13255 [Hydrococcus sp. C42_A2020_068]|uniref:hypothetical protein n=1 Tax=Pleurocapsa sp. PCC 7327 TaxID=118163 RepID=UPI00029FBC51|nr:hypothetical protein [Pleurocapsa sp. PCC 7327]AFY79466.1 hypothetical protein Ple7327_4355 [Pleurocapsa sp. PCC 7327]MBF2021038.1 hypothetical protein [Hydrococcus sp. C42_A2020_068]
MLRQISLILGIGAFLTICANTAQAEPVEKTITAQRVQRSTRDFFDRIENRSFANDPEVFFPEISQETAPYFSEGTVGNLSMYDAEFEAFGEEFKVDVGENIGDRDLFFNPSVPPGRDINDEKVRVLIELEQWNNQR